jgi:hypothetical protein
VAIQICRLAVIIPEFWAERGRENEVTEEKKIQTQRHRAAKAVGDKEHTAVLGVSLLFEKNKPAL